MDGALPWEKAQALRRHLGDCPSCADEAGELENLRALVRSHGRVEPPSDLAMSIRLRIAGGSQISFWNRIGVRLDNVLRPLAIPATAGLLATVLTFGVLIHTFVTRNDFIDDVPVALTTPPKLRIAPPIPFNTTEEGLWLETNVDDQGRIVDYRILNGGSLHPTQASELRQMMVFTQFEPATLFGRPISGRTVINLRRISVKG